MRETRVSRDLMARASLAGWSLRALGYYVDSARGTLSAYGAKLSMPPEKASRIAMLVGLQPAAVILALAAERSGTPQLQALWKARTTTVPSIPSRMVFVTVPTDRAPRKTPRKPSGPMPERR